jgi:nucleoside-diphosphate-sugar epimerase
VDLAQTSDLRHLLAPTRLDACIHLAWHAAPPHYLHEMENLQCLSYSLALLRTLSEIGCPQVVAVGTCAEYAANGGRLRETGRTEAHSLYAAAKLSLSLVGEQLAGQSAFRFVWARLFYLYGPYEHEARLLPAAIRSLLDGKAFAASPGEQVRDYLYVEDVARALVHLAMVNAGGAYNVCSGSPVSVRHLLEQTAGLIGREDLLQMGALPYRNGEPMVVCGDHQRLSQSGWLPQTGLAEGLSKTIDWWRRPPLGAAHRVRLGATPEQLQR